MPVQWLPVLYNTTGSSSIVLSIYPSESLPDTSCYSSTLLSPVPIRSHAKPMVQPLISGPCQHTLIKRLASTPFATCPRQCPLVQSRYLIPCALPSSSLSIPPRLPGHTPAFHCHAHCGGEPDMNLNGILHQNSASKTTYNFF